MGRQSHQPQELHHTVGSQRVPRGVGTKAGATLSSGPRAGLHQGPSLTLALPASPAALAMSVENALGNSKLSLKSTQGFATNSEEKKQLDLRQMYIS